MFYAHQHPEHLKDAAGVIDAILGNLGNQFGSQSSGSGDSNQTPVEVQAPDKIDVAVLLPFRAGVAKLADARDSKSRYLDG